MGIPHWIILIPNILGSIIPELIINQFFEHCSISVFKRTCTNSSTQIASRFVILLGRPQGSTHVGNSRDKRKTQILCGCLFVQLMVFPLRAMVKLPRYPLVIGHYLTKRSFIAILDLPLPFQISGGQSKILNKQIYMFRVEETRQWRTKVRVFQLSKSDCDQPIWDMPDCSNMCPQTLLVQFPNLKISNWDLHLLNDILNQLDTGNKSPRHCVVAQGRVGNRNCNLLHSYNCPFINDLPSMVDFP